MEPPPSRRLLSQVCPTNTDPDTDANTDTGTGTGRTKLILTLTRGVTSTLLAPGRPMVTDR